jgi:hypothetical protein
MRFPIVLAFVITAILVGGCASNYSPRADLSSVQTIGLSVPSEDNESNEAQDILQLYNRTVGEDRLKNSAVGAGKGAAIGGAAGIGVGAIALGCTAGGPLVGMCWAAALLIGAGTAVLGGGAGAIAGATVDTQEQVQTAPVHLYEVSHILPDIKQDYLTSTALQGRALQIARLQDTEIDFEPAAWNGERYVLTDSIKLITDTNLALTTMNISLNGKAEDDPLLTLNINMQWDLTKYNHETKNDETWDAMIANYESRKHRLSEWLSDGGALLRTEVDTGIEYSLKNAFTDLPRMAR